MAYLTIFTAPKPFTNPHIAMIQRNALESWLRLGPEVEVLMIGDEEGVAETARFMGIQHLPGVECNASGTPLISSIFDLARQNSSGALLAYVNADIVLLPDLLAGVKKIAEQRKKFLLVGQRWDLQIDIPLDFSEGWLQRLKAEIENRGRLHPPSGSDYFVFPRTCFTEIPDFAVGRAGWDNWMIYKARRQGWAVVDGTRDIRIVHQDHDYSHLPNGEPHYRLPETFENVRLAGGKRTIFHLEDVNWRLIDGRLRRPAAGWKKFWREVEIFPLIKLRSMLLGQAFFAVFHLKKAYGELRHKNGAG